MGPHHGRIPGRARDGGCVWRTWRGKGRPWGAFRCVRGAVVGMARWWWCCLGPLRQKIGTVGRSLPVSGVKVGWGGHRGRGSRARQAAAPVGVTRPLEWSWRSVSRVGVGFCRAPGKFILINNRQILKLCYLLYYALSIFRWIRGPTTDPLIM